ncbi:MAG: TaqI-like C-terminal specificity domain-containing protein [Succinivibrio sp.]|nr:TaqI-like C-terminal specificity domain-containing protein [Succinivibrio sp.]
MRPESEIKAVDALGAESGEELIGAAEAGALLRVSRATAHNWARLGRLVQKGRGARGQALFSRAEVLALRSSILKDGHSLSSRRNKSASAHKALRCDYVEPWSPNAAASERLALKCQAPSSERGAQLRAALLEVALRLLAGRGRILNPGIEPVDSYYEAWRAGRFKEKRYDFLLKPLEGRVSPARLTERARLAAPPGIESVRFEDTLGLIYLTFLEGGRQSCRGCYYTPAELADRVVALLPGQGSILDPCCGSGCFELRMLKAGVAPQRIYAAEIEPLPLALARVSFALETGIFDEEFYEEHFLLCDSLLTRALPPCDAVIGNPPWGQCPRKDLEERYRRRFAVSSPRPCLADLFVQRGLQLLRRGGMLRFLLPQALLDVEAHRQVRDFVSQKAAVAVADYLGDAFRGVQCPSVILTLTKSAPQGEIAVTAPGRAFTVKKMRPAGDFGFLITDEEYALMRRIEELKNPLKLKDAAVFSMGIVTGGNAKALRSAPFAGGEEIISGQDVTPFHIKNSGRYLRFERSAFQQCPPEEFFRSKCKIVYRFIATRPVAALDTQGRLTLNSCNFMIPKLSLVQSKALVCLLNSMTAGFYWKRRFRSLKVLRSFLEALPLPELTDEQAQRLAALAEHYPDSAGRAAFELEAARCYGLDDTEFRDLCAIEDA